MKARLKDTGEIIELAEEGIISHDGRRYCWHQVELLPEPVDEVQPSLPSDLDEAAEEYEENKVHSISALGTDKDGFAYYIRTGTSFSDAFKAGAEWMAGQGVTVDGVITKVGYKLDVETTEYILPEESEFERGDKVIVQIRKKQ